MKKRGQKRVKKITHTVVPNIAGRLKVQMVINVQGLKGRQAARV